MRRGQSLSVWLVIGLGVSLANCLLSRTGLGHFHRLEVGRILSLAFIDAYVVRTDLLAGRGGGASETAPLHFRQLMAHLFAFRFQVALIVLVDRRNDWHLVDHAQIEATQIECFGLLRIVR